MTRSAFLLAFAILVLPTVAVAQTLTPYMPAYDPRAAVTNPRSEGSLAMIQKSSDAQTEGCDVGTLLSLPGTGTVERAKIWLHPHGGGYVGCATMTPAGGVESPNIAGERYGQGWQWSTRAHSGVWNPTQAGTTEWLGARVRIDPITGGADVAKYRVPLFQNQKTIDFVNKEVWWADDYPSDGGASDTDGFAESTWVGWTDYDEVISEIASGARYKRVVTSNGIPAFSVQFSTAYEGATKSLDQFTVANITDGNGNLVYEASKLPKAVSTVRPGAVTKDTAASLTTSWGVRLDDANGWTFTHTAGPTGNPVPITLSSQTERYRTQVRILRDIDDPAAETLQERVDGGSIRVREIDTLTQDWSENTGLALQIVSTSANPNGGRAIGIYVPRSRTNRMPVTIQRQSDGVVEAVDNRRVQAYFTIVREAGSIPEPYTNLTYKATFTGLQPPGYQNAGLTEAAFTDVVVLFGTPNEIRAAATAMEADQPTAATDNPPVRPLAAAKPPKKPKR